MQKCAKMLGCGEVSPHTTTSGRRRTAVFDAVVQTNDIIPSRAGAPFGSTGAPRCAHSMPGTGRRRHLALLLRLLLFPTVLLSFSVMNL